MATVVPETMIHRLAAALGIPKYFLWFELKVPNNDAVTVKCEFIPEPIKFEDGDVITELAEYELVRKDADT